MMSKNDSAAPERGLAEGHKLERAGDLRGAIDAHSMAASSYPVASALYRAAVANVGRLLSRCPNLVSLPHLTRLLATAATDPAVPKSLEPLLRDRLAQAECEIWQRDKLNDPIRSGEWIDAIDFNGTVVNALPKVSIIIPAYEAGPLLYDALDSIAVQGMRELETLIIDDASPSGGPVLSKLATYPGWMRIRLFRLPANRGPAHCRNVGALLSRGRAVCFLDADDTVDAEAIASRWELLNADPSTAGAFVSMALVGDKLQPLGQRILHQLDVISFADFASNKFPCSALMLRRSSFLLDLFDESLVYGEDFDCFARIAQRGGIYRRAEKGEVKYRQHGASLTHKDTLRDLSQRMAIMRRVHTRELAWTLNGNGLSLSEATINRESSLRAFPVGCVFALRGEFDQAMRVLPHIAADMVATLTPKQAANTLRFFLTREEQVPASQVAVFLKSAQLEPWMRWLDVLFRPRHRRFVAGLVAELTGMALAQALPLLPRVLGAPLTTLGWGDMVDGDVEDWRGYLLFCRSGEAMPAAAAAQTSQFLSHRGDLDGLLVYRVAEHEGQCLTQLSSVCPHQPDASELAQLGHQLWPALVLHEQAARAVRQWIRKQPDVPSTDCSMPGVTAAELLALRGVIALRLKVVGGVAPAFVLANWPEAETRRVPATEGIA